MDKEIELFLFVDTREQQPLDFSAPYIKGKVVEKLEYGDYCCRSGGRLCPMFFERKSLSDLFGTLGKGNERFRAEIARCFDTGHQLTILIERPLGKILEGAPYSKIPGSTILRTLFTLLVKYEINFVCFASRAEMATYISEYFYAWAKHLDFLDGKNKLSEPENKVDKC